MITATITRNIQGKNIAKHRKEDKFYRQYSLIVLHDGKLIEAVTLRLYQTPARTYACVWLKLGLDFYNSGSAMAEGCGYHRASAAAHHALLDAGVTLSSPIDGRGDDAIEDALIAIAVAAGYGTLRVFKAHG